MPMVTGHAPTQAAVRVPQAIHNLLNAHLGHFAAWVIRLLVTRG